MEQAFSALLGPFTTFAGLLALGFFLGRRGIFTPKVNQGLAFFLLKATLPCLIFTSFLRPFDPKLATLALGVLGLSALCYGFYFLLAAGVPRLLGPRTEATGVHRFALIFSNVGFMGYPLVEALLGKSMIFFTAIFNIPFQFLVFTLGVRLMAPPRAPGTPWVKETLLNPGILATSLGFLFFLASWTLPAPLLNLATSLGSLTTPLSMVLVGSILAASSLRAALRNPTLWILSFFRLLFIPFGVFLITLGLDLPPGIKSMAILIAAMPVAANTTIFAAHYQRAQVPASQAVALSTLLSLFTLPLTALIYGFFKG